MSQMTQEQMIQVAMQAAMTAITQMNAGETEVVEVPSAPQQNQVTEDYNGKLPEDPREWTFEGLLSLTHTTRFPAGKAANPNTIFAACDRVGAKPYAWGKPSSITNRDVPKGWVKANEKAGKGQENLRPEHVLDYYEATGIYSHRNPSDTNAEMAAQVRAFLKSRGIEGADIEAQHLSAAAAIVARDNLFAQKERGAIELPAGQKTRSGKKARKGNGGKVANEKKAVDVRELRRNLAELEACLDDIGNDYPYAASALQKDADRLNYLIDRETANKVEDEAVELPTGYGKYDAVIAYIHETGAESIRRDWETLDTPDYEKAHKSHLGTFRHFVPDYGKSGLAFVPTKARNMVKEVYNGNHPVFEDAQVTSNWTEFSKAAGL